MNSIIEIVLLRNIMVYRRRRVSKAKRSKRYVMRKTGWFGLKRVKFQAKKGFLKLTRKTFEVAFASAGPAGTVQMFDQTPLQSCLQLGTPVLSNGASSTANYDVPFSLKFRLSQIINSGDVTTICDQYKIAKTYIRVIYNKSESSPSFSGYMPYIEYINDFDDASPPTINQMREKMGVVTKVLGSNRMVKMSLTPKVHITTQGSQAVQPVYSQWINTAFPDIDHYAVKGVIKGIFLPGTTTGAERITFDIVHKVLCKDIQ